jgi:3-dehydroquinate synthase class II
MLKAIGELSQLIDAAYAELKKLNEALDTITRGKDKLLIDIAKMESHRDLALVQQAMDRERVGDMLKRPNA